MKKARKLITFILATVMVLSMSLTAWADENTPHTITISSQKAGYTYEAYQVFSGDFANGKLSNIDWGSGIKEDEENNLLDELVALQVDADGTEPLDTPFADCENANEVAKVLALNTEKDNNVAKAFAETVEKYLIDSGDAIKTSGEYNANTSTYSINVMGDGYYFIKNTSVPNEDSSYTRYMLEVVKDVEVAHKGTYPTATKEIKEGEDKVAVNEASIGDTIEYVITGTIPENIDDYNEYYYVFTDTLSSGLTYNGDVTVTIDGNDYTDYFYVTPENEMVNNTIKVGMQDLLALENITDPANMIIDITAATKIVISYSATLNENASVGSEGNDNTVVLDYSNDPNVSGSGSTTPPDDTPDEPEPDPNIPTGKTPTQEVSTYVTKITITKVDGDNANAILTGAKFKIEGTSTNVVKTTGEIYFEDENGTYYKLKNGSYTTEAPVTDGSANDTSANYDQDSIGKRYDVKTEEAFTTKGQNPVSAEAFVNEDGELTFSGLGAGIYTLTEVVTPDGYNTISPITFTISFENGEFSSDNPAIELDGTNNVFTATIANHTGSELPSTGGIGTTIFYIVGGVLVLVAVVMLVTKKRMKED